MEGSKPGIGLPDTTEDLTKIGDHKFGVDQQSELPFVKLSFLRYMLT